jgi:MoaA/NifB/PqqE/SkfB family radical SAM enzyme
MSLLDTLRCRRDPLSLDWIQIELTSICNASCFYCPHTVYKDRWRYGSMNLETFKRVSASFKMAKLIYLQGWGEPFLNESLLEMIAIAKRSGCKVGLTSNGMRLDPETVDHLIDLKLDILGISLAGTRLEIHNRLRSGTDFDRITRSLMELKEKKARKNTSLPEVHLAYIMMKSNFEDLGEIITYAKSVGSKDLVCSNINYFPSPELRKEAIFLDESKKDYYYETLQGLKARAKKNEVNLFFYSPFLKTPMLLCPENILRSCYISHNGLVSSCVFTNLPISMMGGERGHLEGNMEYYPGSITYGNINHQSLSEIWKSHAYKGFRHIFEARQKNIKEDIDLVIDAIRAQVSGKGKTEERNGYHQRGLPDHCRNCYRMLGV